LPSRAACCDHVSRPQPIVFAIRIDSSSSGTSGSAFVTLRNPIVEIGERVGLPACIDRPRCLTEPEPGTPLRLQEHSRTRDGAERLTTNPRATGPHAHSRSCLWDADGRCLGACRVLRATMERGERTSGRQGTLVVVHDRGDHRPRRCRDGVRQGRI